MKRRKEDYFIIAVALVLVFVIFGIVIILVTSQRQTQTPTKQSLSPTLIPQREPTTTDTAQTNPPVSYNQAAADILLEKIKAKKPLSQEDQFAKAKILASLGDSPSGYVYQTERVDIEYVHSADAFLVEIRTSNIDQAKAEATLWLQTQGMSKEGICNYPVQFYLNYDVAQYLRGSGTVFSPLAPGCN